MGAEELNQSLENMQQINDSWTDFEDHEETLSLCDLVTSSDANEYWNDPQSNSPSDHHHHHHDQDLFEFCSEEFFAKTEASSYLHNNKNIMFCGKFIPCKDQQSNNIEDKTQKQENDEIQKISSSSCLFPWKISSYSFNKSRTFPSSSSSRKESQRKSFYKCLSMPASSGSKNNYGSKKMGDDIDDKKFDFSVKKVSILATPVKSRWYLFAFGVGRFPMEIELKDMKMRQSRKDRSMKFQAPEASHGGLPGNVKGDKERRRSGKRTWRLLKVLGVKMLL